MKSVLFVLALALTPLWAQASAVKVDDVRSASAATYGLSANASWDEIMLIPARLLITVRLRVSPEDAGWERLDQSLSPAMRTNIAQESRLPPSTPLRTHLLTIVRRHTETELSAPKGAPWQQLMASRLGKLRPKTLSEAVLFLHMERAIFWEEFDEAHIRPFTNIIACTTTPARCT